MRTLFTDSFDSYSDGNLATVSSGVWTKKTALSDAVVTSHQIGTGTNNGSVVTSFTGSSTDQWSQCVIATKNVEGGPTMRDDGNNTFYRLMINNDGFFYFVKTIGGSDTVTSQAQAVNDGDTVYLEAQGTTMVTKYNGTTVQNFTDAGIASGTVGLSVTGASIRLDAFAAGDFSSNPIITSDPQPAWTLVGSTATFTVTATGTGTLHYQWVKNGSNVGTDSSSYTTGTATVADDLSTVYVTVTDDIGPTNSSTVFWHIVPSSTLWLVKA